MDVQKLCLRGKNPITDIRKAGRLCDYGLSGFQVVDKKPIKIQYGIMQDKGV